MQYTATLAAIGLLFLTALAATAARQLPPGMLIHQAPWPNDGSLMLQPAAEQRLLPAPRHHLDVHAHRSPGKPSIDVELLSPGLRSLPLAVAQTVELQLQTHLRDGFLRVHLEASGDLLFVGSTTDWEFELDGTETLRLPVELIATSDGQHYLHLFIEHRDSAGQVSARALATEFRVGVPLLKQAFAKTLHARAQPEVISLPGQETIQ